MVVIELSIVELVSTNDRCSLLDDTLKLFDCFFLSFNFSLVFSQTESDELLSNFTEFIVVISKNLVEFTVFETEVVK